MAIRSLKTLTNYPTHGMKWDDGDDDNCGNNDNGKFFHVQQKHDQVNEERGKLTAPVSQSRPPKFLLIS